MYFKTYFDHIKDKTPTGKTIAKQLQHIRPGKHTEIEFAGFTDDAGNLHPRPPATDINYSPEPVYEDQPVQTDYGLDALEYESGYPEFQERITTTPDKSFHLLREDHLQDPLWQEGRERSEILDAIAEVRQQGDFSHDSLSPEQEIELNINMAQAGYADPQLDTNQQDYAQTPDLVTQQDQDQTLEQRAQAYFPDPLAQDAINPMNQMSLFPDPLAPYNAMNPLSPSSQGNGM